MRFSFRDRATRAEKRDAPAAKRPPLPATGPAGSERASFAAGCFWGVEAAFRDLDGVLATAVGYTDGTTASPSYRQVCAGRSGHAEAVEVYFDPAAVSYEQLLDLFWSTHNPTTRNRQGLDIGSQYRSAIFFHSAGQEAAALASREREQHSRRRPIATEIAAASVFHRAEEYHQRYLEKSGRSTCAVSLTRPPGSAVPAGAASANANGGI